MAVDYTKLWKLLIDRKMNKSQLKEAAHISTNAVAKLGKNESASLDTLERYKDGIVLDCFAGSSSTAVAALKNGWCSISIEIDEQWISQIEHLLRELEKLPANEYPDNYRGPLLNANLEKSKLAP